MDASALFKCMCTSLVKPKKYPPTHIVPSSLLYPNRVCSFESRIAFDFYAYEKNIESLHLSTCYTRQ